MPDNSAALAEFARQRHAAATTSTIDVLRRLDKDGVAASPMPASPLWRRSAGPGSTPSRIFEQSSMTYGSAAASPRTACQSGNRQATPACFAASPKLINATATSTPRCVSYDNNWLPPTASYVQPGQLLQSALCEES